MKYQKSMMKIMEHLLNYPEQEFTLETLIKKIHTGRNTSFAAFQWLEQRGLITIKDVGRQKMARLRLSNESLQYKYFLDSLTMKALPAKTRLIVLYISYQLTKLQGIKAALLFGSALKSETYNDIDILLIGREHQQEKELQVLREQIDAVFDIPLNIHYATEEPLKLFEGMVIYLSSYFPFTTKLKQQYEEYVEWTYSATLQQKDKQFVQEAFGKALINLAFCHALLEEKERMTKGEAVQHFLKSYKAGSWRTIKEAGVALGTKIYR